MGIENGPRLGPGTPMQPVENAAQAEINIPVIAANFRDIDRSLVSTNKLRDQANHCLTGPRSRQASIPNRSTRARGERANVSVLEPVIVVKVGRTCGFFSPLRKFQYRRAMRFARAVRRAAPDGPTGRFSVCERKIANERLSGTRVNVRFLYVNRLLATAS